MLTVAQRVPLAIRELVDELRSMVLALGIVGQLRRHFRKRS